MGAKVEPINDQSENFIGYMMACPGCGSHHVIRTVIKGKEPVWKFEGTEENPTFSPSILARELNEEGKPKRVCHFFIKEGVIDFLTDCTHSLAGKKVPMKDVEE